MAAVRGELRRPLAGQAVATVDGDGAPAWPGAVGEDGARIAEDVTCDVRCEVGGDLRRAEGALHEAPAGAAVGLRHKLGDSDERWQIGGAAADGGREEHAEQAGVDEGVDDRPR